MTNPPFPSPDERLDWVWLAPIAPGDDGFPAGFPSTVNAELERTGPRWALTQGLYVADWIESNCVGTDGRWVSQPVKLLRWEERALIEAFEVDPETLARKVRWVLVGLPKKNGKTELLAWVELYMLHGDEEPAPLVVCCASSDEQADLVFGAASFSVTSSDRLKGVMKAEANRILVLGEPRARMQRVAAAAGTNDGKNIHCLGVDELHEFIGKKLEAVWNILTNGLGAREQPMVWQITTAGVDEDSVCKRQYLRIVAIREGDVPPDTFWGVWFECPRHYPDGRLDDEGRPLEVPYDSEDAVRLSNPSFGFIMHWDFYKDQLQAKTEAVYRRYFLNQWTESEEVWEGSQYWDANVGSPTFDTARSVCVGIDISLKHDATAVVVAQWSDSRAKCQVRQRIWENPFPVRHPRHGEWRLSLAEVEDYIRTLTKEFPASARVDDEDYPLPGPAFFYDPMLFERSAQALRDEGLNLVEFPQTEMRMTEASQRLFELVKQTFLEHDGNDDARRHVRASAVKETPRGWRIARSSGTRVPNDFTIACAIACLEATRGIEVEDWEGIPTLSLGGDEVASQPGPTRRVGPEPGQLTYLFTYTDGSTERVYAPNQALALEALHGTRAGKHLRKGELVHAQAAENFLH